MSSNEFHNVKVALEDLKEKATYRLSHNHSSSKALQTALQNQSKILSDLEENIQNVHQIISDDKNSSTTFYSNCTVNKLNEIKSTIKYLETMQEQTYQQNLAISNDLMQIGKFTLYEKHSNIQSNLLKAKQRFNDLSININLLEHYLKELIIAASV